MDHSSTPAPHAARYRTPQELTDFVPTLDAAPTDRGLLKLIVRRPAVGEREVLAVGRLDPAYGLEGDSWLSRGSTRSADGRAHPDMQLNVMSHRMVAFLAQDPALEPLAGDQLYLDLDLSEGNLPAGSQLAFGDPDAPGAVIEVTEQPHTGCAKFVARFGPDAMRFVNGRVGRPRRLRGLNARVVLAGQVHTGDLVTVRRPS
ncbi:MAG: hypothetical protein WBB91_02025 [Nostocoides sp.]|uniref:hypothetical protein n=1 Tax=Nostocoides sp. TaxID=1917966 RepID=UPI003BE8C3D7